jgi:gp16 family phage-associated protein
MALTVKQIKEKLARQGKTQKQWAMDHGYRPQEVTRVLNGQCRALRGKGHEIAVQLGLKDPAAN